MGSQALHPEDRGLPKWQLFCGSSLFPQVSREKTLEETQLSSWRAPAAWPQGRSPLGPLGTLIPSGSTLSPWHDGLAQASKLGAQPGLTHVGPSANHPMVLSLNVFIWVGGGAEWPACLQGVGSLTWANPLHSPKQPYEAGIVIIIVQSRKGTHRHAKRFA